MKRMTLNNLKKTIKLIMDKGYNQEVAENMAVNCFAMVDVFGGCVEDYVRKIEEAA